MVAAVVSVFGDLFSAGVRGLACGAPLNSRLEFVSQHPSL